MLVMRVEIRERQPDASERTVAVFRCDGRIVTCDNPVIWNHLIQASGGVIIGERGRRFTPRDGDEYLRNLRFQYRGPYLFAIEVDDPATDRDRSSATDSLTARAVVVEVPEDAQERRAALGRAIFVLFVQGAAGAVVAAAETRETVSRLLEAEAGIETLEAFSDDDLRIRLNQARYGVTPPPAAQRLAAKVDRQWQLLLGHLGRGTPAKALVHAQLMGEHLRSLGPELEPWATEAGLWIPPERECVGTRPGEVEAAWEELGWTRENDEDSLAFLALASRRSSRGLAQALEAAPRGELYRALVTLRQAVSYDPSDNEGRTLLGEVLLRMEHPHAMVEVHKALFIELLHDGPARRPEDRLGSLLRRIRLHRALARGCLVQGWIAAGRRNLESAMALHRAVCDYGGTGWGGAVSEEEVRALGAEIAAVLDNLSRSTALDETGDATGRFYPVGGGAQDSAGIARTLAGGEEATD